MIRKFIKDSSWILASNLLSKIVSFATLSFLARTLKPDQMGFYHAVQNSGNSINMISSFGTAMVIQRVGARIEKLGTQRVSEIFSNAFTCYFIVNFIAAILIFIFPEFFFEFLLDSKGKIDFVIFISLIIVLNALSQGPVYLLLGLEEFRAYAIRNFINSILILLVSVLLIVILHDNLMAAFYALILAFAMNTLLTGWVFFKAVKRHRLNVRPAFQWSVIKSVFSEGFFYFIGNTFLPALSSLVIISLFYKYLSSFDYGFLRIGSSVEVFLTVIPAALQPVTISLLAKENDKNAHVKSLQIRIVPFFSTLVFVVLAFNIEMFLQIFFGSDYIGASSIVFWMVLLQIPVLYLGLINNYQIGGGQLNYVGYVAIVGCLTMIGGTILLIPYYGIKGYFAAQYVATFLALGIIAYREYFRTGRLSVTDINSFCTVGLLILLSYAVFEWSHEFLRIPLTILTLIGAVLLFWKYSLTSAEKARLVSESKHRGSNLLRRKV